MDTGNELDEILSGDTAPAAATTTATEATPAIPAPAPAADAGQPRGPDGKFAPKASDAPPAASPTPEPTPPADAQPGTVPQQALHAARQSERAEKDRADRLERELAEVRGQVSLLSQRAMQPPPKAAEPVVAKDIWEDPDGFVKNALTPVQEQMRTVVLTYSRREAIREHGAEKVDAAEAALKQAIASGALNGKEVTDRLQASLDPVGDVVNWHTRQSAISRVGNDPDKWLESELERRLNDPAEQAKILERIRASASTQQPGQTPATKLPPSLSRLPGGANEAKPGLGDDSERFARALAR